MTKYKININSKNKITTVKFPKNIFVKKPEIEYTVISDENELLISNNLNSNIKILNMENKYHYLTLILGIHKEAIDRNFNSVDYTNLYKAMSLEEIQLCESFFNLITNDENLYLEYTNNLTKEKLFE